MKKLNTKKLKKKRAKCLPPEIAYLKKKKKKKKNARKTVAHYGRLQKINNSK